MILYPNCPRSRKGLDLCNSALAGAVVVIVSWEVTGAPFGVTVAGEKLQLTSEGSPEQAKVTAWLKPPIGVSVSVAVPDCPCLMVKDVALTLREKSGAATELTSPTAVEVLGLYMVSPL